ncbi:MAG: DMT family transporter [Bacteroidia bacterium]|nr:DMT family transporter [Bacteroidia bacterium]
MPHLGEILALATAILWTTSAIIAERAVKRVGALNANIFKMALSLLLIIICLFVYTGTPFPKYTNSTTWIWLCLSSMAGYVFGDMCLFTCYKQIGSRFGQLFMTIAPLSAALFGWFLLGESLTLMGYIGMTLTIVGIMISVFNRQMGDDGQKHTRLKLPLSGVLCGIGAGVGQGVGLVLSKQGILEYEALIPQDDTSAMQTLSMSATFIRAFCGVIGFTIILLIKGDRKNFIPSVCHTKTLLLLVGATLFGPFIGVSLSLEATRYASVGVTQTIMSISPILIIIPAILFFKQKVTLIEVIGALISVAGVALFFV